MKEMYLVEYGSSYSYEPWEPKCIFTSEELAKKYVETKKPFEHLYHITKLPVFSEESK